MSMHTNPIRSDEAINVLSQARWVTGAAIVGTGGGCRAIEVTLTDGRKVLLTNGDLDVEFTDTVNASLHEADEEECTDPPWVVISAAVIGADEIRAAFELMLARS